MARLVARRLDILKQLVLLQQDLDQKEKEKLVLVGALNLVEEEIQAWTAAPPPDKPPEEGKG